MTLSVRFTYIHKGKTLCFTYCNCPKIQEGTINNRTSLYVRIDTLTMIISATHTKLFRIRSLFLRDAVFGCTVRPKIFNWSKPVRAIFCLAKVTLAFNEHHYNASCTNDHYKPLSMALAVLSFLERGCSNFLQNLHQTTKNPLIFKLASVAQ